MKTKAVIFILFSPAIVLIFTVAFIAACMLNLIFGDRIFDKLERKM